MQNVSELNVLMIWHPKLFPFTAVLTASMLQYEKIDQLQSVIWRMKAASFRTYGCQGSLNTSKTT